MATGFPAQASGEARFPEHDREDIIRLSERILDDLGWHFNYVHDDRISVRTATGIWFFGDQLTVDVSKGGTVRVHSRCIWPTQIFDFGRNDKNVERFLDRLERKLNKLARLDAEREERRGDDDRQAR
jgi:hypothetical protein